MQTAKEKTIIIFGGARDYHAMDWYRSVKKNSSNASVIFLTDQIAGEGFPDIREPGDNVKELMIIDRFLFQRQSRLADLWRNVFKIVILPIQVVLFRNYLSLHVSPVVHCQPLYYALICLLAGQDYIVTPQGSDVLIRPARSRIYKRIAKTILERASAVTVDSVQLQRVIQDISGVKAFLVQDGIDTKEILRQARPNHSRTKLVSIRGLTAIYRIKLIDDALRRENIGIPCEYVYPFADAEYLRELKKQARVEDEFVGRLPKKELYDALARALLVISIPSSDSSPRSVYEAIFAGSAVAVTSNDYVDQLPLCMRAGVCVVDITSDTWLTDAFNFAREATRVPFSPSEDAVDMFDENIVKVRLLEQVY